DIKIIHGKKPGCSRVIRTPNTAIGRGDIDSLSVLTDGDARSTATDRGTPRGLSSTHHRGPDRQPVCLALNARGSGHDGLKIHVAARLDFVLLTDMGLAFAIFLKQFMPVRSWWTRQNLRAAARLQHACEFPWFAPGLACFLSANPSFDGLLL